MNPYVVGAQPNYAMPMMNFGQQQQGRPGQGPQGPGGPGQPGQGFNPANSPAMQWAQQLRKLFGLDGQQGGGLPMQLGPGGMSQGNIGGTAGNLSPLV